MAQASPQPPPNTSLIYRFVCRVGAPISLALWTSMRVEGQENLPRSGSYILASNHPDNLDTYCIGMNVQRTVHFLARPSGMQSRWLGRFWKQMAAVSADREGLAEAIALLKVGEVVGVYPDGVITSRLVQAKAGVGALAVRSGAPVVPVAVWGTEYVRLWPWHGLRRQRVVVRFGAPRIYTRAEVHAIGLQGVYDMIMREVAALLPAGYRGVYAEAAPCQDTEQVGPAAVLPRRIERARRARQRARRTEECPPGIADTRADPFSQTGQAGEGTRGRAS
jgi:1-acyl-sn-glycerol-3-phosphate acyltransferase